MVLNAFGGFGQIMGGRQGQEQAAKEYLGVLVSFFGPAAIGAIGAAAGLSLPSVSAPSVSTPSFEGIRR